MRRIRAEAARAEAEAANAAKHRFVSILSHELHSSNGPEFIACCIQVNRWVFLDDPHAGLASLD